MTTGWAKRDAAAARVAAALLAGCGALALSACEQLAEPRPAYEAGPPPPPAALAGEPESAPSAAPPLGAPQPGLEPAPAMAPPEGAPPPPEPPPPAARDEGLVAMAPIPNPEDGGPVPPGADRRRYEHPRRAWSEPPRQVVRRHHHRHGHAPPTPVAPSAHRVAPAPRPHVAPPRVAPHAVPPPHAAGPAPARTALVAKIAPVAKPAPTLPHERRATRAELRRSKAAANTTASNTTGADADARVETLRSALSAAVAKGAVLTAPKASADQAADVTLTLPATFYDTVKTEAGKQAMGDAAASANADATLTGDGYAIIPAGAQAQPLRVGQPTTFHWTVTAPAGAKGPVRADMKVDLLGGGSQVLALGAVDQASPAGGGFRWWGAALLIAVVLLGFWWLLSARSADARIAASRRRARRPDGTINGHRPLDMRPDDPPQGK